MTIAIAWVGTRKDKREHLYMATDSRVSGGQRLDVCPKILTLPRSDCALCFAGSTGEAYPLMIQMSYAIAAHEPARERNIDIARVLAHLLRIFTDTIARVKERPTEFDSKELQFIFAGYSWLRQEFRIWTIYYEENEKKFRAREALKFLPRLEKVAFIGDVAKEFRSEVFKELGPRRSEDSSGEPVAVYLEPLQILGRCLKDKTSNRWSSVGGAPQLVRLTRHMTTRPLCVRWDGEDTLFGRPLFNYENVDYWIVNPETGKFLRPRKFGYREAPNSDQAAGEPEGSDEI